jgi:hypothetical protein
MGALKSAWKAIVASSAIIAILLLGVLAASGVDLNGGDAGNERKELTKATTSQTPDPLALLIDSALTVSTRDRLAICVQVAKVDPGFEPVAEAAIEAALPALSQQSAWFHSDYPDKPSPIVDRGCPSGPVLYSGNAGPKDGSNIKNLFDVHSCTSRALATTSCTCLSSLRNRSIVSAVAMGIVSRMKRRFVEGISA